MSLLEVHEAIAIEPGLDHLDEESLLAQPQDILDLCSSLLSVSEQGHVRLAHFSVKEYLQGPEIKKEESLAVFALDSSTANHELAVICISYLSFKDLATGPSRSADAYDRRMSDYPLLPYAALSWTYFVRETTLSSDLRTSVFNFFSPTNRATFMSWVQVLNAADESWDFYPSHATPLYYAASFGLLEIVEGLIQDPEVGLNDAGSRYGGTALHAAVLREHLPVMRALLEAGADPNQGDFSNVMPLHSAALGREEAAKMLIEYGASLDLRAYEDMTPFEIAISSGQQDVAVLLTKAAIERAKAKPDGRSPKDMADSAGRPSLSVGPSAYESTDSKVEADPPGPHIS